uniref:Secreted protein n=1 Tax=Schistosoma mansoni TaxID=6183 RepID=A0A5K4E9M7_SCHMA
MLNRFIVILVFVFVGIVTFDNVQGKTNNTITHTTNHYVGKLSHHNTVPAKTTRKSQHTTATARHHNTLKTTLSHHNTVPAKTTRKSQHPNTTPSHTDKTVQKKCLNKMTPQDLISLLFSLIPQIKTIEFSQNENLLKLATILEKIFEQQSRVEHSSPTKTPANKIFH